MLKIHYYSNLVSELIHANLERKIGAQVVSNRNQITCLGLHLYFLFRWVATWMAVVLLVKIGSFATVADL